MATALNFTSSKTIVNTESFPWSFYGLAFIKWVLGVAFVTSATPPLKKKKAKERKRASITPELRSILINFPNETRVMLIA